LATAPSAADASANLSNYDGITQISALQRVTAHALHGEHLEAMVKESNSEDTGQFAAK
jgi:hypothetical protein